MVLSMKKATVAHILMSEYKVDSRVANETHSLSKHYDVEVLCMNRKLVECYEAESHVKISRYGYKIGGSIFSYAFCYVDMLFSNLFRDFRVIHAHDLNGLIIGYVIAKLKRIPLIYDSHELWSESLHNSYPKFILKIAKRLEKKLAQSADGIITVSDSIARYLEDYFNVSKIEVIRNVPSYIHDGEYDYFRNNFGFQKDIPIFLYQGLISKARGVPLILEALGKLDGNKPFRFIFLGDGPYVDSLQKEVIKLNLQEKVFWHPSVNQNELLKYTASVDIGVHAINNSCLNHEYCLPNKIFEYINSGIGIICPNLVELKKLVDEYGVGSTFECGSSESLADIIRNYIDNPNLIQKAKHGSSEGKRTLSWTNEESKLIDFYRKLLD